MTKARWVWLIRAGALAIVLAAVAFGTAMIDRPGSESDPVTGPWDLLDGRSWLLPDLDEARLVMPDRPHARQEVDAHLEGAVRLTRTRSYTLSTNAWRLRGPPLSEKTGTRIAVLGDSVAMGHGVNDAEAWPSLLEEELRSQGHDVRVLNAGCPAAGLDTMEIWCRKVGTQLDLDLLVWARRGMDSGTGIYRQHLRACEDALGVPVVVVLHPTSGFDLRALRQVDREAADLERVLAPTPVLDLNPAFRAAAKGGYTLSLQGETVTVSSPSGQVVASGETTQDRLPTEVYALFEQDDSVREALFFDGAHPDVEGNALYAREVVTFLSPRL